MICNYCGTKIPDNVKFCPECGAATFNTSGNQYHQPSPPPAYKPPVQKQPVPQQTYKTNTQQKAPASTGNSVNSADNVKQKKSGLLRLILSLIMTVVILIGAFSGNFVLIGTESSGALIVAGLGFLAWDIYCFVKYFRQ